MKRPQLLVEDQDNLMQIEGKHLMVNNLSMANSWGRDRLHANEACVFRIELPCYPNIWQETITIKIDLLVLVETVGLG